MLNINSVIENFRNDILDLLELLTNEISKSFLVDKSNKQQLSSILIYSTIVEYSTTSANLLYRLTLSSMPLIIRPTLEAYIDLTNCINHKDYWLQLRTLYLYQLNHFYTNEVKTGNKSSGKKTKEFKQAEKSFIDTKRKLKDLRDKGYVPISIKEKFKIAGALDQYNTIYKSLCLEAHNDLMTLENKHLIYDGDIPDIVLFKQRGKEEVIVYLDLIINLLRSSTKKMIKYLDVQQSEGSIAIWEQFDLLIKQVKQLSADL